MSKPFKYVSPPDPYRELRAYAWRDESEKSRAKGVLGLVIMIPSRHGDNTVGLHLGLSQLSIAVKTVCLWASIGR